MFAKFTHVAVGVVDWPCSLQFNVLCVKTPYLSFIAVDGSHHFTYNKTGVQEVA
jgi:hypothetical protein